MYADVSAGGRPTAFLSASPDAFSLQLALFLAGLLVLLVLLFLVARWWSRLYREEGDTTGVARRVLKNSLTPTVANLINRAVDLAFAVVVLHYLGKEGNGYYAIAALLVGGYMTTFTDFGLTILTTREVARDPQAANRYLVNTVLARWFLAAACVPLVAAIIGIYSLTPNPLHPQSQAALGLLTLSLFPAGLSDGISSLLKARERMEIPAFAALLTNALKVFCGVGVLAAGWGVVGLAASALLVTTLNMGQFIYLQHRFLFRPRLEVDLRLWRWMVPEALPLMLNNVLMLIFFRFDYFILQGYSGARAVGAYDAAYKLPNALGEALTYILFGFLPLLARYAVESREKVERLYTVALKALLLVAFPLAMAASVLAPQLVYVLGGRSFLPDSAIALAILIWFLPLRYINGLVQYTLIALNRQRAITLAFLVAAVFNIALNFLSIPRFGDYGYIPAGILTIVTEAVVFTAFYSVVRRELGRLPVLQMAWRPLLATLAMGAGMVGLAMQGWWAAALAAGTAVYAVMLLLLRTFTPQERTLLRRMWPGKGGDRGPGG